MLQVPNFNYSHPAAVRYLVVRDLRKANASGNEITIKYSGLDPDTKGPLKNIIDQRLCFWIDKENYIDEKVFNYLKKLFKNNQGNMITIEYNKLMSDPEDDKLYEIIHKTWKEQVTISQDIRYHINKVLTERKSKLYNNMVLNPTI